MIEIVYGAKLTKDGRPCISVDYTVGPREEFDKLN